MSWSKYYEINHRRPVRRWLIKALDFIRQERPESDALSAIDIGSGQGIEAAHLLQQGWTVVAIDREPDAKTALEARVVPEDRKNLTFVQTGFEEIVYIPPCDLVYSYDSLPFCSVAKFPKLLKTITNSIRPKGYFVGSLFGLKHDWVKSGACVGISHEELASTFASFKVLAQRELDQIQPTALEGDKHWHCIDIIARKMR